jgi:hypothetical protein
MLGFVGFMQKVLLVGLLAVAGGYFWYVRTPCHIPIRYSVGSIDNRFNISQAQLQTAIAKAIALWEGPSGAHLFAYTNTGGMPISFVYDARQANTQKNNTLKKEIEKTSGAADSIKVAYESDQVQYEQAKKEYLSAQAEYRSAFDAYNTKVAYWNARNGAPPHIFNELQSQKQSLALQAGALEQKRLALNALADRVNALGSDYNELAQEVNETVGIINQSAGKEFEEGLYTRNALGAKIEIYEYSSEEKLVRVLAHEFGHALGLEHNTNPDSIMYELNQSENMVPTVQDLADLRAICGL